MYCVRHKLRVWVCMFKGGGGGGGGGGSHAVLVEYTCTQHSDAIDVYNKLSCALWETPCRTQHDMLYGRCAMDEMQADMHCPVCLFQPDPRCVIPIYCAILTGTCMRVGKV